MTKLIVQCIVYSSVLFALDHRWLEYTVICKKKKWKNWVCSDLSWFNCASPGRFAFKIVLIKTRLSFLLKLCRKTLHQEWKQCYKLTYCKVVLITEMNTGKQTSPPPPSRRLTKWRRFEKRKKHYHYLYSVLDTCLNPILRPTIFLKSILSIFLSLFKPYQYPAPGKYFHLKCFQSWGNNIWRLWKIIVACFDWVDQSKLTVDMPKIPDKR